MSDQQAGLFDSKHEQNMYLALSALQIPFEFQVAVMGGRNTPFGQVVDFVCYLPFAQPVQVFGQHWHTGHLGALDELKLALLETYYRREVLVAWSYEIETPEMALAWAREHL